MSSGSNLYIGQQYTGLTGETSYKPSVVNEIEFVKRYSKVDWAADFIRNTSPQIIVMGGRRGTKTTNASAKMAWTDLFFKPRNTDSFIYYASKTFEHAHSLMWGKLKAIRSFFDLTDWNMKAESDGIVRTPRCTIKLLGFNDMDSIGKALGQPFKLFVLDECQEIRDDILKIVNRDAASWGAMDNQGTVVMMGNPPRAKFHFFSQEWLHAKCPKYRTNVYKNPFMKKKQIDKWMDKQREIRREIKGQESPEFRRMAFGEIVFESSNSVFSITNKNYYENPPFNLKKVIGVDMGFRRHDAIAVLGWSDASKKGEFGKIYLLEEHQEKNASNEDLGRKIDELSQKHDCYTVIVDTGGLGVKVLPDFMSRYSKIQWVPADKREKAVWIKLLQTEIIHGRFLMKKNCQFEQDASKVEWEEHSDKLNEKVAHSDILDAVLYGTRYCHTNLVGEIIEEETETEEEKQRNLFLIPQNEDENWDTDNAEW